MPNQNLETEAKLKILPERFDPVRYADRDSRLVGHIKSAMMQRLQQSVLSMQEMVSVDLQCSRSDNGYPMLNGQIQHRLGLRCERCLDEVSMTIERCISVVLKPEDESLSEHVIVVNSKESAASKMTTSQVETNEQPEFYDYDGKSLLLAELIEEELMLALPLIPKHKDISLCDQDMVAWLAANEVPEQKRPNPFAILKR